MLLPVLDEDDDAADECEWADEDTLEERVRPWQRTMFLTARSSLVESAQ